MVLMVLLVKNHLLIIYDPRKENQVQAYGKIKNQRSFDNHSIRDDTIATTI